MQTRERASVPAVYSETAWFSPSNWREKDVIGHVIGHVIGQVGHVSA